MLGMGVVHAGTNIGWLWANCSSCTTTYNPPPKYSYNSAGGKIDITGGNGAWQIVFRRLYQGKFIPDNVQASAYATSGYCAVGSWGHIAGVAKTDLVVTVNCWDANGNPANERFTVFYQSRDADFGNSSSGLAYLRYFDSLVKNSYNSTGGTNAVTVNSVGNYTVTLPGLTANGGDVQVTAFNGVYATRCNVGGWYSTTVATVISVQCFNGKTGQPTADDFSLAYALNEPFGLTTAADAPGVWAWANNEASTTTYTPDTLYQFNGYGTGNFTSLLSTSGNYAYSINVPGDATFSTSVALATAYAGDSRYCNPNIWTGPPPDIYVVCYSQGGNPVESEFNMAFQAIQ